MQVIFWKSSENILYNLDTGVFPTLKDYNPQLAAADSFAGEISFIYTDTSRVQWVVSVVPFFKVLDGSKSASTAQSNSLIMLVFAKVEISEEPLIVLQRNIIYSTNKLVIDTIISLLVAFIVVSVVAFLEVMYIFMFLHI